jgi:hypothetical protein
MQNILNLQKMLKHLTLTKVWHNNKYEILHTIYVLYKTSDYCSPNIWIRNLINSSQILHLSNNDLSICSHANKRLLKQSNKVLRIFHPFKLLTYSFIQIVDMSNNVLLQSHRTEPYYEHRLCKLNTQILRNNYTTAHN